MNAISDHGETTRLGSYEILRQLTRGGMAEIFLARTSGPSGFEKLVVLKKILSKYADKPRYVQLFLDEAKLAASLDHPNIAQVYDIGMVDGSYFFAMEHLHGQDVRSILHRSWRIGEPFPIEHAVQIAHNVGAALHFAHEKRRGDGSLLGLVHRDVSPSNVIVTYDGATKLLDFGVAKTAASTVKTRTGALKGKISYMSPEQARGAPIDRRSDIFSLGIVLWELVTTQRLYRADNDLATLQLIIHQPPRSPSSVRPDCPPELERIVLRALAQDPAGRYDTAEQLVLELDELAREHKLKQTPHALAAALGQLFGSELAAWREAQASGVGLADHLQRLGEMTAPISESDFIDLDDVARGSGHSGPSPQGEPDRDDRDDRADDLAIEEEIYEPDEPIDDDDDLTEHAAPMVDVLSPLARDLVTPLPVLHDATTVSDATAIDTLTAVSEPPPPAMRRATPGSPFPPVIAAAPPVIAAVPPARVAISPFGVPPWQSGQPSLQPQERVGRSWSVIDLPAFDPDLFARQRRIVFRVVAGLLGVVILLAILAGRC